MSTKISKLPESEVLLFTDIFPVVNDPSDVAFNKKATFSQLATLLSGVYVRKAGDTMTGPLNMTAGQSYKYDGASVIQANLSISNIFFGPSGNLTMTGVNNLAVGINCLVSNTTGNSNVALGNTSLRDNTTGVQTTALGEAALRTHISGFWNTAVGYNTGIGITTGISNTIIGANVTGLPADLSNNVIIADGAGNRRINVIDNGFIGLSTTTPNSGVHITTSLSLSYVSVTSVYTVLSTDYTVDCTANTFTVSLPTATGITGRIYVVKNSGAGTITLDPSGSETIDGASTQVVVSGSFLMIQSNGANWIVI